MQWAIAATLVLFVALFRLWPLPADDAFDPVGRFNEEPVSASELIIAQLPASVQRVAPPVPRSEVPVPDEEVVDMEVDLELDFGGGGGDLERIALPGEGELFVEAPEYEPTVRRIVEPVTPTRAREDGVRMQIVVRLLVGGDGRVIEAEIQEMLRYNQQTGSFEPVTETGYGFRDITLRAARQWLFHPARHDGQQVRSYTTHRFTF